MKIIYVFDNGGATIDRFTVVFNSNGYRENEFECLGVSRDDLPTYGIGFSQWNVCNTEYIQHEISLGHSIQFKQLPKGIQKHVRERMRGDI